MKLLFFGVYNPSYSRNRVLLRGLKAHGFEIIECRVSWGPFWFIELLYTYILMWPSFDCMLVPFRGHPVMLVARLFTRKPIIFDVFTSDYEGYVFDRKKVAPGTWRARYYHWLDRTSCRNADVVLVDTQEHLEYFVEEFGVPRGKLRVVYVGTDTSIMRPMPEPEGHFLVHFHGHFIPLQGARYIIEAAHLLRDHDMNFQIVGRGQEYDACRALAERLEIKNITFIDDVPYEELPRLIARANVCLGIFGGTVKAARVIPNKVYEVLACKRALITGDTPAARELLHHREHAIMVPVADAKVIADAILELKHNTELRERIAVKGRELIDQALQESDVVKPLVSTLHLLQ